MKEKLVRVNSFLTVYTVATHNKSSHSKSPPTQFLVTGFNSKISLKEEKFYIKMTFWGISKAWEELTLQPQLFQYDKASCAKIILV